MISVLAVELAFVTASSALDELPRYFYDLSGNLETRVAAKSAPLQIIGQPVSPVVAPGGIATFFGDAGGCERRHVPMEVQWNRYCRSDGR